MQPVKIILNLWLSIEGRGFERFYLPFWFFVRIEVVWRHVTAIMKCHSGPGEELSLYGSTRFDAAFVRQSGQFHSKCNMFAFWFYLEGFFLL